MAEGKKSFIAYADWKDTFDALPDDKAGKLIKHVFAYVNDENPVSDDLLINALFPIIRNALKRDLKKWEKQHSQRVQAGIKSAEVRKRNATVVNGRSVSSTVSVNVNANVNGNVNVKKTLLERRADFKKSLHPFLEKYGSELLNDFFSYWTEHGKLDKKMRFEKEKSFGTDRRLSTWLKKQKDFKKEKSFGKKEISLADKMKKEFGL